MEDKRKIFSEVFEDFFGAQKNNDEELYENQEEFPKIEVNYRNQEEVNQFEKIDLKSLSKEQIDAQMKDFYDRIDKLYITEESKENLKKMIEYTRKFQEGIVKTYIPFDMRIYCDNNETLYNIIDILRASFVFFKYIKKDVSVEASFVLIDDSSKISEIYNKRNTIIILRDIGELLKKDTKERNKILNVLEDNINQNQENVLTIAVDKDKNIINEAFADNTNLRDKIFDFEIEARRPTVQEVQNDVIEKLEENYEVTEEFKVKLLDYIVATFPKSILSYPEYIEALCEKTIFNKTEENITENDIPKYEKDKTIEEIFAELDELVGLENVKQMLRDLVSLIEFKKKTKYKINVKDTNLHMVFLGNPGTGKTTVARMVAGILYNLNYIKQNKLIEVSAKDLVAEYVGQTAPKTMAVIEKAMRGVLFIDEAYSLASGKGEGNSFNEECVATIIQAMENYRDNLVVIFAGYSKEMESFLKLNSGIVSRIGYTMTFEDYTVEQLITIFKGMIKKAGFEIEEEAIEKVKEIIEEYKDTENFGNARFVRNLYEKTVIKHATNTKKSKNMNKLKTISKEDISTDNILKI